MVTPAVLHPAYDPTTEVTPKKEAVVSCDSTTKQKDNMFALRVRNRESEPEEDGSRGKERQRTKLEVSKTRLLSISLAKGEAELRRRQALV